MALLSQSKNAFISNPNSLGLREVGVTSDDDALVVRKADGRLIFLNGGGGGGSAGGSLRPGSGISISGGVISNIAPNVQSDWDAEEGPAKILNKPTISAAADVVSEAITATMAVILNAPGLLQTDGNSTDTVSKAVTATLAVLMNSPESFPPPPHLHAMADITGLPATLSTMVGIITAEIEARGAADAALQTQISGKFALPAGGTTSQYINGTGALTTFPSSMAPSGAAGGDLTGTYPSPTIAPNAVSDAKIRQSAALSVVGRSANTTGNVADITAGTDGYVLRRSGTALGFGTVATAGIGDGQVTMAKIAPGVGVLGQRTAASGAPSYYAPSAANRVLRSTAANAYEWGSLVAGDLPSHNHTTSDITNFPSIPAAHSGQSLKLRAGSAIAYTELSFGVNDSTTRSFRINAGPNITLDPSGDATNMVLTISASGGGSSISVPVSIENGGTANTSFTGSTLLYYSSTDQQIKSIGSVGATGAILRGTGGQPTWLARGSAGQVLTVNSAGTDIAWASPSSGGGGSGNYLPLIGGQLVGTTSPYGQLSIQPQPLVSDNLYFEALKILPPLSTPTNTSGAIIGWVGACGGGIDIYPITGGTAANKTTYAAGSVESPSGLTLKGNGTGTIVFYSNGVEVGGNNGNRISITNNVKYLISTVANNSIRIASTDQVDIRGGGIIAITGSNLVNITGNDTIAITCTSSSGSGVRIRMLASTRRIVLEKTTDGSAYANMAWDSANNYFS